MRENAGEISLCGNVREKRAKCGSLPPNAGGLATMRKLPIRFFCKIVDHSEGKNCTWQFLKKKISPIKHVSNGSKKDVKLGFRPFY